MLRVIIAFGAGLVAGPLGLLALALSGVIDSRATPQPPDWEAGLGRRTLHAALARAAAEIAGPPSSASERQAGQRIYADDCAGCHGEEQKPSAWGLKGFYPRVPQLARAASGLTREQMFVTIKYGVRYSGMGAWDGMLSDADIWRVTDYLASRPHQER